MLDRPPLKRHLLLTWEAFHQLSGDRPTGFAVGPIPFTAVDRYAARYGIRGRDEFERFHGLIMAMDRVHQQHIADKTKETPNG